MTPRFAHDAVLVLIAACILLCGFASAKDVNKLICEASGYCSLSQQPSHFIGPVGTNKELKKALEALAYKKEIIITLDNRPDYSAQFVANFHAAGYGHVMLIAPERLCWRLSQTMVPLGCVWYPLTEDMELVDVRLRAFGRFGGQMYLKHWTGARIARMGYNVMVVDQDVLVMSDFYFYVKSPPLADKHVMIQADGGIAINCGFVYIQNAAPNGPAVWALADAMIRTLRWRDAPEGIQALGIPADFVCWDQNAIHDAFYSAVVGRPTYQLCIQPANGPCPDWTGLITRATNAHDQIPSTVIEASDAHMPVVGQPSYVMRNATIQLPHIFGAKAAALGMTGWPQELGGKMFGSKPMSDAIKGAIHDYLVADVDVPLWPDLEDESTVAAAAAVPTEHLLFAPVWLANVYISSGVFGHWHRNITDDSRTVIGHICAGLPPGKLQKRTIAMCAGLYDFGVSGRLWGGPMRAYTASHHNTEALPPVIAYAPGVFDHTTSHDDFGAAISDLGAIAVVSKHLIGWPGAPLAAGWTHKLGINTEGYGVNGKPHVIPWTYVNPELVMAYTPWNETLVELSGVWSPLFDHGCLSEHTRIIHDDERGNHRKLLQQQQQQQQGQRLQLEHQGQQLQQVQRGRGQQLRHSSQSSLTSTAPSADDDGALLITSRASLRAQPGFQTSNGGVSSAFRNDLLETAALGDLDDGEDHTSDTPSKLPAAAAAAATAASRRRLLLDTLHIGRKGHHGRGLMPPELKHYVSNLPPLAAKPGPHNTLQVPAGAPRAANGAVEVSAEHVKQESLRMSNEPIVWLSQRVRIVGGLDAADEAGVKALHDSCCAMQYADSKAGTLKKAGRYLRCAMRF